MEKRRDRKKSHQNSHQTSAFGDIASEHTRSPQAVRRLIRQHQLSRATAGFFRQLDPGQPERNYDLVMEEWDRLGQLGPSPRTLFFSLLRSKTKPKLHNSAVMEIRSGKAGSLLVRLKPGVSALKAGRDLTSFLKQRQQIEKWAAGPWWATELPFSESSKRGSLAEQCLADTRIVSLYNAGRSVTEILGVLVESHGWKGDKRSLHERLKKRIRDLRKTLGPSLVRPVGAVAARHSE